MDYGHEDYIIKRGPGRPAEPIKPIILERGELDDVQESGNGADVGGVVSDPTT